MMLLLDILLFMSTVTSWVLEGLARGFKRVLLDSGHFLLNIVTCKKSIRILATQRGIHHFVLIINFL